MSAPPFPHASRPCGNCPWRLDATPGEFSACRYEDLRDTVSGELFAPIFACHKSTDERPRACAGWLAVEGHRSIPIRLAIVQGRLDPDALDPGPDWPPLHDSYDALAEANGASR